MTSYRRKKLETFLSLLEAKTETDGTKVTRYSFEYNGYHFTIVEITENHFTLTVRNGTKINKLSFRSPATLYTYLQQILGDIEDG